MSDDKLLMSKELEGQIPELSNATIDTLFHVLYKTCVYATLDDLHDNVAAEQDDFVGSLLGMQVTSIEYAKKLLKIDITIAKEDALLFIQKLSLNQIFTINDVIISNPNGTIISIKNPVLEAAGIVEIDHKAGIAVLSIDVRVLHKSL